MSRNQRMSLLLVFAMLLNFVGVMPVNAASYNYKDAGSISKWAESSVKEATEKDFISGFEGKFNPKNNITRAEFIKIITNVLDIEKVNENKINFVDVKTTDWYYEFINTAFAAGVANGSGDKFNPNSNITREEMATMLSRALKLNEESKDIKFKDMSKVSDWAKTHVIKSATEGLILGDDKGNFSPKMLATREMATVSAMRAYKVINGGVVEKPSKPESKPEKPVAPVKHDIRGVIDETGKKMYTEIKSPGLGTIAGDWTVLGLARGGVEVPKGYYDTYYNNVVEKVKEKDGKLHHIKYTEYSRLILGLTSIGRDVTDVGGYNLLEPLADFNTLIKQGINGPIFALIAFDTKGYEIPVDKTVEVQTTREMLIEFILDREIESGGWALGTKPKQADVDITGMAIQALSPYYNKNSEVKRAVDKGIEWLSSVQNEDGGYKSWGSLNSESANQVIVALTSLGIDPHTDPRFIKNGKSVVDNVLSFKDPKGGFYHVKAGNDGNGGALPGVVDAMATDQAMYSLVAYDRFVNNQNRLYDMTDVK